MIAPSCRAAGVLLLVAALLACAGCVDRRPSVRERRERFDRRHLAGYVLAAHPEGVPPAAPAAQAVFDRVARLAGVQLEPAAPAPGARVTATFVFEVLEEPEDDYRVFVHVDDRTGKVERINADHEPVNGAYPTSVWRKGEFVRDVFVFWVPPYSPPGTSFELWTGFFSGDQRLPVTNRSSVRVDGSGRVLAAAFVAR